MTRDDALISEYALAMVPGIKLVRSQELQLTKVTMKNNPFLLLNIVRGDAPPVSPHFGALPKHSAPLEKLEIKIVSF